MLPKQIEESFLIQEIDALVRTEDCADPRPEMSDMDIDVEAQSKHWKIDIVSTT